MNAEVAARQPLGLWPIVAGILAGLALGFLVAILVLRAQQQEFSFLYEDFTIDACMKENPVPDARPAEQVVDATACFNKLVQQGQLNEFQIRRINFQNQHFANNVNLWMVVTLTLCGVALSVWQIAISRHLVARDPSALSSEIAIERGRLFVRSSVTGLLILIVSFAFFFVYVAFIYRIEEWRDDAVTERSRAFEPLDVPLTVD